MPSGRHDHEIGRDRRGNPSRDRSSVGDRNSKGTGLRDKREPTKELRQALGSQKVSELQNPKTPTGKALESTDANDATRYGVGALASAGSPEQRNAIAGQTDDINSGDGLGGLLGLVGLREKYDLSTPVGTRAPANSASWGWDPISTLATAIGAATGIPVGTLYNGYRLFGGKPPVEVNLGPDVFGANPTTGEDGWGSSTPQTAANPDAQPGGGVAPEPVAQSRSPLNNRIGGYSGGGYNMGAFGKKPSKKTNYLTQQLMAP